jgi:hypothetical protein
VRKRRVTERLGKRDDRGQGCVIQLFFCCFLRWLASQAGLHANPYSSKFKPLARQRDPQFWSTLAKQCRGRAACSTQFQLGRPRVDNGDMFGKRRRQDPMYAILQGGFTPVALQQVVECGFTLKDLMESAHGTVSARRSATGVRRRTSRESVI